jgi:transcriptional regulator with XRE-family HTH domain
MTQTIGERLRYLRYEKNWTKARLADAAGVPLATISLVERGLRSGEGLSVATVRKLAQAFEISVQDLIGDHTEEPQGGRRHSHRAALLQRGCAER